MKKLFLFCMAACLCGIASAQKVYFVYLQTEDQSPFYIRMVDKIYSSTVSGYLILSNLSDSTYNINLGFAKSTQPETRFAVTVNQADKGFLIKKFNEGISLFDLQALTIIKAANSNRENIIYETRSDRFSSMLSKAADDPGLLKVPVAKKEEPQKTKTETALTTAKQPDVQPVQESQKEVAVSVVVKDSTPVQTEKKEEVLTIKSDTLSSTASQNTAKIDEPKLVEQTSTDPVTAISIDYKPSVVKRRSESSTTEGFGIIYFDQQEEKTDTIRILIPPSKIRLEDVAPVNTAETKTETVLPDEKPLEKTVATSPVETKPEIEKKVTTVSCASIASDKDFMKLRKNMAAKDNDEGMIDEAKKMFRSKCFTVEQIRYLSTLFLTSAAKYQFFDASYNHVTEKGSFNSLQTEIKDEYYLKRFKALIGE